MRQGQDSFPAFCIYMNYTDCNKNRKKGNVWAEPLAFFGTGYCVIIHACSKPMPPSHTCMPISLSYTCMGIVRIGQIRQNQDKKTTKKQGRDRKNQQIQHHKKGVKTSWKYEEIIKRQ